MVKLLWGLTEVKLTYFNLTLSVSGGVVLYNRGKSNIVVVLFAYCNDSSS